jgi:hypothetical protein
MDSQPSFETPHQEGAAPQDAGSGYVVGIASAFALRATADKSLHPSYRELLRPYASAISRPCLRHNNPPGKSPKTCPALRAKIFRLTCRANQHYDSARLTR